ncbi:hypothetical protein BC936DRAFT_143533 [Jimgerdemannia flammicorona]|uniref:Uncharacterized protein n=1 Tax=Jimgerdemannia flammicorona TaxID=994334 RepID=A0A433DDQ9_9FUNG|nr:hypothetical protein BC936DRAFT_143533 [Jimgerdemannia flammicorona]
MISAIWDYFPALIERKAKALQVWRYCFPKSAQDSSNCTILPNLSSEREIGFQFRQWQIRS